MSPPFRYDDAPTNRFAGTIIDLLRERGAIDADTATRIAGVRAQADQVRGNAVAGAVQDIAALPGQVLEAGRAREDRAMKRQMLVAGEVGRIAQQSGGDPTMFAHGVGELARMGVVDKDTYAHILSTVQAQGPEAIKQYALFGDQVKAAAKTREIRTKNPDGSEKIQIVEDAPGFEATSAAPPAPPVGTRVVTRRNADGTETTEIVEDKPGYSSTSAPEPKTDTGFSLSPGQTRFGPDGKPIASLPAAPKTEAETVPLSPEGLDAAAMMFAKTGQLPPMGMGGAAAAQRAKIINRAAVLMPGLDVAAAKADFTANSDSLKKLQGQRDAIGAFEETALKNLDVFIAAAKKVSDTGSPTLNKPLRSIQENGLGSEELTAYNTARRTVIPEFAKILANPGLSGQLSDSARHEIEEVISGNATLKQTLAAAQVLKTDAANRRTSYDDQIAAIKSRISKAAPDTAGVKILSITPVTDAK